ncbi:TRAP-type mannitol/chloroaromatic compound transport system, substrate-binding protein [Ectothiorhodosinus mongolicus]|uniref:TRAP-type mannitol/chloroaromatic compound transport system, substrate-binding protein n=1 Tax=Ectothiorhodosinus mongolicus TaxID=233100 RepID=A0A1R3VYL1_9GAMM|nr:TRAP transporter substrate-binding protein [Ectothiorhodosinus mongolicus]ULX57178.1 ABC transporter substrate-binding protein [Ectothiorhodosinus mongolicus]SIT70280.1 TRAP-type mannitol/chloroaromatic compound transport system, substrate-binding protein [Ectothiorhodosinus mongolicus]
MSMKRRDFLKAGTAAAAGATILGAPAIVKAQQTFNWRMTTTWPAGLPFFQTGPGSATDFARRVEEMSGGRIRIRVYSAGELVPAFEGFDAASAGRQVQLNHGCAYYWAGKSFAAQYFTTVPFGMTFQGHNAWMNFGGGYELYEETYRPFNLVPLVVGCTGVQPVGWFRRPVESLADFRGLNIRMPGLAGDIYNAIGANARLLPGGELFAALERGAIDAAEWVGPYSDRELGLHRAASLYYSSGWHEPATSTEVVVNRSAWDSLPADLQAVMRNAAAACNITSHTWLEAQNADALDDLINNHGTQFLPLPDDVIQALLEATKDILSDNARRDDLVRRVNESYFTFKAKHDRWNQNSETMFQTQIRDLGQQILG